MSKIRPEVAKRRIESFGKRFGKAHLYLAYHAAFPLSLTPDLLYRLWANFQRNIHNQVLGIPWIAVADLLLSSLCDEVGHELYEMDLAVRNVLLSRLKEDEKFAQQRINELSDFLLEYVRRQLLSDDPDIHDFAQAQHWVALAYTRPSEAVRELSLAFSKLNEKDIAEMLRMASLTETFAEPLAEFQPLLIYARGMKNFARGNLQIATEQLSEVLAGESQLWIAGVSLPIPEIIRANQTKAISIGADGGNIHLQQKTEVYQFNHFITLTGHSDRVYSVSFSPNGKTLVSASADNTVKLWDTTGNQLTTLTGHSSWVYSVSFSPNGKTLASASGDKTVKLWDTTGNQLATLKGHSFSVYSVSFSPDGKILASASYDKTVILWSTTTGNQLTTLTGHRSSVNSVSFSPDGKILASASGDKTVILWNTTTGKKLTTLRGHSAEVRSVSLSPDGKILASGSYDKTVILWDITGKQLTTLKKHSDSVCSVSFSPDGKILASASWDKTVILWSTTTGNQLTTLTGHSSWIYSINFSPDGKTLASASGDNTVKLWNLNLDEPTHNQ